MLHENGAYTSPCGAMNMPQGGKMRSGEPPGEDQYSDGNSSVVTLRSHSVMIQSFSSGSTW